MRLDEILNLQPLPYKWISPMVGTFEFNDKLFGIVIEPQQFRLPGKVIIMANIVFGIVIDINQPISVDNLDITITNFGRPRTVMATVAEACIHNSSLLQFDMILVGATSEIDKREGVYILAVNEIGRKLPQYSQTYRITTPMGARIIILSKMIITPEEESFIGNEYLEK